MGIVIGGVSAESGTSTSACARSFSCRGHLVGMPATLLAELGWRFMLPSRQRILPLFIFGAALPLLLLRRSCDHFYHLTLLD